MKELVYLQFANREGELLADYFFIDEFLIVQWRGGDAFPTPTQSISERVAHALEQELHKTWVAIDEVERPWDDSEVKKVGYERLRGDRK